MMMRNEQRNREIARLAKRGLSDAEIAEVLDMHKDAVYSVRRANGIPSSMSGVYAPRTDIDWPNVDWSKTDTELAQILGMDRKNVGARREKLGAPPAQRTRKPAVRSIGRVSDNDWSIIESAAGCNGMSVEEWSLAVLLRAAKRKINTQ